MSLPAVLPDPIGIYRGDSSSTSLRFWSDTAKTVPVDLTGFGSVFTAQLRTATVSSTDVAFTVVATAAATGLLTLTLTPAQTAVLSKSSYGFDVQAANIGGTTVTTLITGKLAVSGDYTR